MHCDCCLTGKAWNVWNLLRSLNGDLKAAIHCDNMVDVFIDQDDYLIEALMHLSNIQATCWLVLWPRFYCLVISLFVTCYHLRIMKLCVRSSSLLFYFVGCLGPVDFIRKCSGRGRESKASRQ